MRDVGILIKHTRVQLVMPWNGYRINLFDIEASHERTADNILGFLVHGSPKVPKSFMPFKVVLHDLKMPYFSTPVLKS